MRGGFHSYNDEESQKNIPLLDEVVPVVVVVCGVVVFVPKLGE